MRIRAVSAFTALSAAAGSFFLRLMGCAVALLGAAALALVQFAAAPSIEPMYDVKPMAQAIRQLQAQGVAPQSLAAAAYGEYRSVVAEEKLEERSRKERIEIHLEPAKL